MMNIQKMMQQAQQMQMKLQEMQAKFEDIEVGAEAGAGLVKVRMSCDGKLRALDIDPSLLSDKETLEDLVIAAVNNAGKAKDQKIQEETQKVMEELGMPAGTKLPF